MFSNEIKWCYFGIGCVFCVLHFLGLLTTYTLFGCAVAASVVHYYFYKRNENFRHRLSVLGLVKHDKRERKVNSHASQNCVDTDSWKGVAERPVRTVDTSHSPGHFSLSDNFITRRRSLSASWNREGSAFTNSLSFVNKAIVEQQRKHTFGSRSPRKSSLDWEPAFHKRYPVQQEKYAVGKYPAVCLSRSPLPTAKLFGEQDGTTPVRVKILPLSSSPKQRVIFSPQMVENNEASKQDPCSTEAVLRALKERRKRAAVSSQDDVDKGEATKRQRKENTLPPASALPTPTYCPASMPSFGGTMRSRASEKRPCNSMHESPGDGPKRVRNNAIFSSFCSSRSLLEKAGQTHKRKASSSETPPQMKITKKDDRTTPLSAGSQEAGSVIEEKTTAYSVQEQKDEEIASPHCEAARRSATSLKREFLPSDQSVRKKKLVFPEHVATMQEHEQDCLLEKQRLNLMLGSISDLYQSCTKPDTASVPQVAQNTTQSTTQASTNVSSTLATSQPVTQGALTTSAAPTILSTSTQVTEASKKSPTVSFGVPTSGSTSPQPSTEAQFPLMNTSTPCVTVPKMSAPATAPQSTSLQMQTPCTKTGLTALHDGTFVATAASTASGPSATAITYTSPALLPFSLAPVTAPPATTSSKSGVLPPTVGLPSPLAPPKTADTPTRSVGGLSKSTPFAFGSTSVTSSPFTFGAQVATSSHSQPTVGLVPGAANSFCATQATSPATTTQSQGFAFSAPSRTPFVLSSSAVNVKSPQMSAGSSLLTPTSSVLGISRAPPTSVPSATQGGVKFTPAASGGFSFATTPGPHQATSSIVTNGVNGIGSTTAPTAPVFKFGGVNTSNAPASATFNFSAQQNSTPFAPKQNVIQGSNPGGPVLNNSLFSIGSVTRSERPMATPRSRRSMRK
ncbi:mucin-2-like [Ornithodoros turicata]